MAGAGPEAGQTKGTETKWLKRADPDAYLDAIEQVYDWIGERIYNQSAVCDQAVIQEDRMYYTGKLAAYAIALGYIRLAFAGLVDFEQTEEKNENGL